MHGSAKCSQSAHSLAMTGWRTIDSRQIGQVTAWPSALAAGATWDVDGMRDMMVMVSAQAHAD